jgi:hypothetical protein
MSKRPVNVSSHFLTKTSINYLKKNCKTRWVQHPTPKNFNSNMRSASNSWLQEKEIAGTRRKKGAEEDKDESASGSDADDDSASSDEDDSSEC